MSYPISEKIYYSYEEDFSVLDEFMREVVDRREDNRRGGLQAAIVLLQDRVGAKVCDRNGLESHNHSLLNLVRFLNGREDFLYPRDVHSSMMSSFEQEKIKMEGIEIRIISSSNMMQFTAYSYKNQVNDYQKKCLKELLELLEEIRNLDYYQELGFGICLSDFSMGYEQLTDERIQEMRDYFVGYQRRK